MKRHSIFNIIDIITTISIRNTLLWLGKSTGTAYTQIYTCLFTVNKTLSIISNYNYIYTE